MRKIQFMKIDFIRTGSYKWLILLFPLFSGIIMMLEKDSINPLFAIFYSLFGGIIFSSVPFCQEKQAHCGFIHMLPAKNGEPVAGHFLYSLTMLLYDLCAGFFVVALCRVFRPIPAIDLPPLFLALSAAFLVIGIQDLVLSLIPSESSAQAMALIRMIPGFAFYFGALSLSGTLEENPLLLSSISRWFTTPATAAVLAVSILLFFLLMKIGCTMAVRRDAA